MEERKIQPALAQSRGQIQVQQQQFTSRHHLHLMQQSIATGE